MPSTKAQKAAAARAQAAKSQKKTIEIIECSSDLGIEELEPEHVNHNSEIECTGWNGGVNYVASDTETDDEDWKDTDSDSGGAESGEDNNKDIEGLEGEDLLDSLRNKWELLQQELEDLGKATPYKHILKTMMAKEWKTVEANCGLGYNGQLAWQKREIAQQLQEKEVQDKVVDQAEQFQCFFTVKAKVPTSLPVPPVPVLSNEDKMVDHNANEICQGYFLDVLLEGKDINWADDEGDSLDLDVASEPINHPSSTQNIVAPPQSKLCKLDIPAHTMQAQAKQACLHELNNALLDIQKLISLKKTQFAAGANGLQLKCAHSIENCLHMVVNNKQHLINSSEHATECQGFAAKWGGWMVRQWVQIWIKSRELPKSEAGCHKKVFSLLDDPEVQTELCSYIQTNKWSTNPQKLSDFTKNKLLPDEAKKYLHNIVETEMPTGLKRYLELELFPHIQMKVSTGISL
ncbi:hypothetical protein V8E53_008780 [Lactarius tabidus]